MGIRFNCPNGHKLHVKEHLAGKRAMCPSCGAKLTIPPADPTDTASPSASGISPQAAPAESPSFATGAADASQVLPTIPAAISPAELPTVAPPAVGAAPVEAPSLTTIALQHRKRRRQQMRIAIGLFVIAVTLAAVLIWVLVRNANMETTTDTAATASLVRPAPAHYAAAVGRSYSIRGLG